jgi:hypothetical protein
MGMNGGIPHFENWKKRNEKKSQKKSTLQRRKRVEKMKIGTRRKKLAVDDALKTSRKGPLLLNSKMK